MHFGYGWYNTFATRSGQYIHTHKRINTARTKFYFRLPVVIFVVVVVVVTTSIAETCSTFF